ncbi:MAG: oligoendopeptidase F, partial [Campylobacter hyointestinalis]
MTWDLTIFFKNLDELDKFSKITEEKALKFNQTYNSNLNNLNPDDFLLAIKEYEDIACNLNKIMSYAQLSFAKDTSKGALLAKYEEICTKIEEKMLFFMLEFNQISKEKQDIFIEFCKPYSYYLELSLKNKPHQLSLAEE